MVQAVKEKNSSNICLIGDEGVGKTYLYKVFENPAYTYRYDEMVHIGINFITKNMQPKSAPLSESGRFY